MPVNIIDIIIIVVILFSIIRGYTKGIIRVVFDLFSIVINFFITKTIYPYTAKFLTNIGFRAVLESSIKNRFTIENIVEAPSKALQANIIKDLKLPEFLTEKLLTNNNVELYKILNVKNLEEYIYNYIAFFILEVLAVIITFILVGIFIKIISKKLDIFNYIPVVKSFNKSGGALAGIAIGLVSIWGIFVIIDMFSFTDVFVTLSGNIKNSTLGLFLYNNNLVTVFFKDIGTYLTDI